MYYLFHLTRRILLKAAGCMNDEKTRFKKAGRDLYLITNVPSEGKIMIICHKPPKN